MNTQNINHLSYFKTSRKIGIRVFSLLFLGVSFFANAQIKEEKLILNRKREPEVKKIEKKKSSVATVKNYPPQSKKIEDSLNLKYQIKDVAAVSDFKTSTIERTDISPKFNTENYRNFVRFGMGNFGKILGDANISTQLENNFEAGADVHYLSTTGLKNLYDWDSNSSKANIAAYLNHYGDKARLNVTVEYDLDNYNYYGIYAFPTIGTTDLQQKVNQFGVRGYYELYDDSTFRDFNLKTGFLSDHFGGRETVIGAGFNLSKAETKIYDEVNLTFDFGLNSMGQDSRFDLLNKNINQNSMMDMVPQFSFNYQKASLAISSHFSLLNTKNESTIFPAEAQKNRFHWFPKAEFLYNAQDAFKFYAGVDGGIKINSYTEMLKENPFLVSDQVIVPTKTKYKIYFGLKGDIEQQIKYDVSAGFGKMENILYYKANSIFDDVFTQNRSAYNYANVFSATYDNGTVSDIKGSLQYFPLQNLAIETQVNYTKYNLDNNEQIYYKPVFSANIGAKYSMLNQKLLLGVKGIFYSDSYTNRYTLSQSIIDPTKYDVVEDKNYNLGGTADINISAEYKVHPNFSIFVLGNNLLNSNYQSHLAYKVLGAQVTGGVKIVF
ncbi:MAG: TonB-dependent receptor [Bacteroidetes bacterium]|nr:TonB-dependent receptor [Bacteroidota bacterium]